MSFSIDEKLPINYFKEVMEDKAEMLRMYLDKLNIPSIFLPYCGYTMGTFKFYSYDDNNDSPIWYYTFSNLGDLEDQLHYFWIQLNQLWKEV